jgi:hypothetical protein
MDNFKQIQEQLKDAHRERDRLDEQLYAARAGLHHVEEELNLLRRSGSANPQTDEGAQLLKRKEGLLKTIADAQGALSQHEQVLLGAVERFARSAPPQEMIEEMDDAVPFLLLPVRLETRFMTDADGQPELWVRIFPDDISIETHESALTNDEISAGRAYWEMVWRAGGDREAESGAWRALIGGYGAPRAAWIAKALTPHNLSEKPGHPVAPEQHLSAPPRFPEPERRQTSWTRAPRARAMPDCFVITTYAGGEKINEVVGRPIPDPLILGPDPMQSAGGFRQIEGNLRVDQAMRWLTDFSQAERIGMAVRIPLAPEQARRGFDLVLALGLRLSLSADGGQRRLENLFEGHHYTDGLGLVPQGTPTNNTDEAKSGLDSAALEETSFRVERGGTLFEIEQDDLRKRDGQRLAEALGIDFAVLQHIDHSDGFDLRDAIAMNRALWPATLGYFMEEMMRPVFDLETIRQTRHFFARYVSGRGALPAIRVGRQPYGVLPVSVFSRWRASKAQGSFPDDLHQVLRRLDQTWSDLSQRVAHAGASADHEEELLKILGLQASSVEFHHRFGVGPDYVWNLGTFSGGRSAAPIWNRMLAEAAAELLYELGYDFAETPKILSISFFRNQTALTGPLIDDAPLSETQRLKPISETTGNYIHWLLNSSIDTIRDQDFGRDRHGSPYSPPTALLYLMLRHALTLDYWDVAMKLHAREKNIPADGRREVELLNIGGQPDILRWDYFDLAAPQATGNLKMKDFLQTARGRDSQEASDLQAAREGLAVLAELPTARLERLFAEHLDLCSYRLDAWQLGLTNLRLEEQRRRPTSSGKSDGPAAPSRRFGIYLGSYGWLEDLRPSPPAEDVPLNEIPPDFVDPTAAPIKYAQGNAGYIHAPSLTHAATAAILRNGYLTHADDRNAELMSIDLSSERVRRAQWYLEGIRNGQPLSALLGYQFERGLHDRNGSLNLDQYISPLRKKFPLIADQLTRSAEDVPIEAVGARNVVDGLKLIKAARPPGGYPYGVSELPAVDSAEGRAIRRDVEATAEALDAVSDLALAESVYQVAQGNHARAGAMLKSIMEGSYPPEPEVTRTPRSGTALTHRVMLNLSANAPDINPWPAIGSLPEVAMSVRAGVERRLNHWLGTMLGDPSNIRCLARFIRPGSRPEEVEVSLRDLNTQPIDFIYLTAQNEQGEAAEVEKRALYHVRQRHGLTQDIPIELRLIERKAEWGIAIKTFFEILPLARSLRAIITGCRPLAADDFITQAAAPERPRDRKLFDIAELRLRAQTARAHLSRAITDLEGAASMTPAGDRLREALFRAAQFGVRDAIPGSALETTPQALDALVAQANGALTEMRRRLREADAALAPSVEEVSPALEVEKLSDAAHAIFGRSFKLVPFFTLENAAEVGLAVADSDSILRDAPPLALDEWLIGLTKVRPKIAAYQTAIMLAETLEHATTTLKAAQLPFTENDRWLALPLRPNQKIYGDTLSLVLHLSSGYDARLAQSGLLIDEWVEVIPNLEETTGIVFHFNQPNSEPPQALLLVTTPEQTGRWSWQDILDALHETLSLMKKRAVEPDQLGTTAYAQMLPAIMTAATQNLATISVNFAANVVGQT